MARLAKNCPSDDWTSTQLQRSFTKSRYWTQEEDVGSKAAAVGAPLRPPGCGSSPFEDALRQLPNDARIRLVDSLTDGGNVSSGKQATLAVACLSCKALCRAIDDGLQSLRLNVLPDTCQGPAPSLLHFPNVTSLTLSIFTKWRGPKAQGSSTGNAELLPGEQPKPRVGFWFTEYAFPPSLLLEPLQGQPLASLQHLQNITLLGQLTSFTSLCKQLCAALSAASCGTAAHPHAHGDSASGDGSSDSDPEDISINEQPSGGEPSTTDRSTTSSGSDTSDWSSISFSSGSKFSFEPSSSDMSTISTDSSSGSSSPPRHPTAGGSNVPSVTAGGADGARAAVARSGSLVHLNLGNVRFPKETAWDADVVARGHAALGPLGLQELTLGSELLAGIEVHKELRRLHIHSSYYPIRMHGEVKVKRLRGLSVQHVGLLGDGWEEDDVCDALQALPRTVASVCLAGKYRATLTMGHDDRGQATRELLLGEPPDNDLIHGTVQALCRWRRALPQAARVTRVKLLHDVAIKPADRHLLELLDRAEHVEYDSVVVRASHVAEVLPRLRAVPREVRLQLPASSRRPVPELLTRARARGEGVVEVRMAVGAGDQGSSGSGRGEGAGVDAGVATSPLPLPALDELLARAVGVMEARASRGGVELGQRDGMGQVQGGGSDGGDDEGDGSSGDGEESDGETEEEEDTEVGLERWWREGVASKQEEAGKGRVVLLLTGPGVSGLAAHTTAEGQAALREALGELSPVRRGPRKRRQYMVLPGGGGVLLRWEGAGEGLAEAAEKAVRGAAAAALGREVPEGGVQAVALPHTCLDSASWGLDMSLCQVLQSEVRLWGDGTAQVVQLQAVAELWEELQALWHGSHCAAKRVVAQRQDNAKVQGTGRAKGVEAAAAEAGASAVGPSGGRDGRRGSNGARGGCGGGPSEADEMQQRASKRQRAAG